MIIVSELRAVSYVSRDPRQPEGGYVSRDSRQPKDLIIVSEFGA